LSIIHAVKHPAGIKHVIIFSAICLGWLFMVIRIWSGTSWTDKGDVIALFFNLVVFLGYLAILLITLFRVLKKTTMIYINQDEILVNGRTIQAQEIKVIMKMGYFSPVIGIKPHGKKAVPVKLCFRFSENEDQGIADLKRWAALNEIKMVNKDFMTWL
jgi:hypothetical protein